MTYLRKSILDDTDNIEALNQNKDIRDGTEVSDSLIPEEETQRYYEYSIYDYCSIPEEMILQIVVSSGYTSERIEKAKQLVPLEELERINRPEDVITYKLRLRMKK